jgi:hypothetical protein
MSGTGQRFSTWNTHPAFASLGLPRGISKGAFVASYVGYPAWLMLV